MCARAIQETVLKEKAPTFTMTNWKTMVSHGLFFRTIISYTATSKILEYFKTPDPLAHSVAQKFISLCLSTEKTFGLDMHDDTNIVLARLGLIVPTSKLFEVTCPLMRDYLGICLSKMLRPPFPQVPLPIKDGQLDVASLVVTLLSNMSTSRLVEAYLYATKKSELSKPLNSTQNVLKEAVYSLEFASLLVSWFPDSICIIPEANSKKNKADIFINGANFSLVLEFVANARFSPETRPSSFLGHVLRAKMYGQELNSAYCVIHFMGVDAIPLTASEYDAPGTPDASNVYVYVFHTHTFSNIQFHVWTSKLYQTFNIR